MGFGDLKSTEGLERLDAFLASRSYIEGHSASVADAVILKELSGCPDCAKSPHAARWYEHIAGLGSLEKLPGKKRAAAEYGPEEEETDLFGSDSEDDPEVEAAKAKRLEEYLARKAKKPVEISKSSIVLNVKPWDDETSIDDLEENVRKISLDGLVWGASKRLPVGYGITMLQISCVIEDEKVGVNDLEEEIQKDEDHVQSIDLFSFNKV
ncbi:MAG: translation elongation factor EF-1 beta subunit (eEF1B) [Amphiamblys sp. WSBS2006]|nr:MAG: translation elongation factor EF-1 beta subunit (eEF1B) [Amphiamblys sp. WSBS2006]